MMFHLAQVAPLFTTAGLAWAGAAAVSVPIAIHLLTRFRRRPQTWGAMKFLLEAYRRHRTRLQIEQLLLLLVRCMILLLLGLALAGPLLSGCAGGMLGSLTGAGRVVHIVMDDSLTSQVAMDDDSGQMRFESLRGSALELVDSLAAGDRVAIWRASRPVEGVVAPATMDQAAAREAIQAMQPRYSRSDLPATLTQVNRALSEPAAQAAGAEQTYVIVLSDFSRSSVALDRPAPSELTALGDRSQLLLATPMTQRANVQIASLRPQRHMIILGESASRATAPIELGLRRFVDESADRLTEVELFVAGIEGERSETVRREVRWAAGQDEMSLNVDLPLAGLSQTLAAMETGTSYPLAVHARVSHAAGAADDLSVDALAADNAAWSVIEVRRRMAVGVVDAEGGTFGPRDAIEPRRWVELVLSPFDGAGEDSPGHVRVMDLAPSVINAQRLESLDAVMVLRPDLLSESAWTALVDFTQRGGLTWFFVPAASETSSGMWGTQLTDHFGLDWRVGIEPIVAGQPRRGSVNNAGDDAAGFDPLALDEAISGAHWPLFAEPETSAVPEPLHRLAADWVSLLRPVRVTRRVELVVRSSEGEAQGVWLRLNDRERSPLLASQTLGDGRVMMYAGALDTAWSNLPTKPLFVHLLHETLHGVLGESPRVQRLSATQPGQRPTLDRGWEGTQQLQWTTGREAWADEANGDHATAGETIADALSRSLSVVHGDDGWRPVTPLGLPGVWSGEPRGPSHMLAVNVDAAGGDTHRLNEASLESWFAPMGQVTWLDANDPAAVMMAEPSRLALAWPLLLAVLVLVLAETIMARLFSHAKATAPNQGPATMGQMAAMVRTANK